MTLSLEAEVAPPVGGRSMRVNFCWVFVGNAMYSVCQWMMLIAMAKLVSPFMLGQFALGLAVASPLLTFTNLQLRVIQATDALGQHRFSEYFGLRTISTAVGLMAIVLIAFLGRFQHRTAAIIVAVGMAKAVETLSDLFYGLFQHREDLKRVGVSMMLRGLTSVAALTAVLYLTRDVLWSSLALMAAWGFVWLVHDFRWGRRILEPGRATAGGVLAHDPHPLRPKYESARLLPLFRLAFPLGIVMMLVALNANVPRYFVEYHLGEANLGMFSAMAYVMVAVTGVAEALGQAATPKLARYYADRQIGQFRSLLVKLAVSIMVLGAAGVATAKIGGRILLTLLYTRRYAEHVDVFVWLTVWAAGTGVALILSQGVSAARCFRVQVPMFAAVALASATGCYLLVPSAGMRGAAIAAAISSLLHVIIATGVVTWILIRPQPQRREAHPHAEAGPYPAPALET